MHKVIIITLFIYFFSAIIDCGCLENPENGRVMLSGTSYDSMVFYIYL